MMAKKRKYQIYQCYRGNLRRITKRVDFLGHSFGELRIYIHAALLNECYVLYLRLDIFSCDNPYDKVQWIKELGSICYDRQRAARFYLVIRISAGSIQPYL